MGAISGPVTSTGKKRQEPFSGSRYASTHGHANLCKLTLGSPGIMKYPATICVKPRGAVRIVCGLAVSKVPLRLNDLYMVTPSIPHICKHYLTASFSENVLCSGCAFRLSLPHTIPLSIHNQILPYCELFRKCSVQWLCLSRSSLRLPCVFAIPSPKYTLSYHYPTQSNT